jgi:hypothetical protein
MPIQLPSGSVTVTTVGGSVVDTIDTEAVQSIHIDFPSQSMFVTFVLGTPPNNSFAPSSRGGGVPATIQVNLSTGAWTAGNGQQSGTLSAAALQQVVGTLKNLRNNAEQFANGQGVVPGTLVPWS